VTVNPLLDVTLAIQATGSSITLSWPAGTLESSTNIVGPWDAVTGATPPSFTTAPSEPQQFFRVRVQ
jgi:hypothetical protein